MNTLSHESKILLDLLANSLFDAGIDIDLQGVDMEMLFSESMSQTVLALAFDALPQDAIKLNAEIYDKWQNYSLYTIQKNVLQMASNAALEKIFETAALPICTIKGFASGYYYGNKKHLRQMGDIDFIVPAKTLNASKELLCENGYIPTENNEDHDFHLAYSKDKYLYEMHIGVTSILDDKGYIEKYVAELFDTSVKVDFDGIEITVPDTFTHGLIMLLHMQRHMLTSGGVGLRHLCDWATFVNAIDNTEWINTFEEKLKSINLWNFAGVLSKLSFLHLKIKEKEWFSSIDDELADSLLYDIISGGNFGRKDIKRYQEVLFLSKDNKDENALKFYSIGFLNKVYSWKPFFKKHKLLVPIGAIAYTVRTVFLILFCKKKVNLSETHKSGKHRNTLYKNLFK